MITLYRSPEDELGHEIERALEDMVIAYETETVHDESTLPADIPTLPALRDEGTAITGEDALRSHLQHLARLMEDWDRFQSDACYIEEDGSIC